MAESRINPITGKKEVHDGLDIAVPMGTPAIAVKEGRVLLVKNSVSYGLMVRYETYDGYIVTYGHLQEAFVKEGEKIQQGQVIAKTGNSGYSTGPHLHYAISRNGKIIDPREWLNGV